MNYIPQFFRITQKTELDRLDRLKREKTPQVFNAIESQLDELLLCRNPKLSKAHVREQELVRKYLEEQNVTLDTVGVWVYYSWKNQLVHVLDEEEFIEVRTNRNKYKITQEEQDLLRTKVIGVIGLSVGRAVATTIALERIAGEIRLADFDDIELSNLNRIQAPLTELGLNKTIATAREIAELDPFIKVKCYDKGILDANIDDFFQESGKLNLLVEECDGLGIKIIVRQKAKELQIPVIMETNDRCMIDIERFDLEPDRELLHGLVKGLNVDTLRSLKTNEEKMPYILSLIDIEKTSIEMRATMLEIEQSVISWPQLGSSVIAGGAITAHHSKNILLNKNQESGRLYNDFENLDFLNTKLESIKNEEFDYNLVYESINEKDSREKIDSGDMKAIVEAGLQAPSAGNNQPWQYIYKFGRLYLFHNVGRSRNHWDKMHMTAGIAMGASITNINLMSNNLGYKVESKMFYENLEHPDQPVAVLTFEKCEVIKNDLTSQIFKRSTNRLNLKSERITSSQLDDLLSISENEDINFTYFTRKGDIDKLGLILGKAEQIRLLNPIGHSDFVREVRWTPEEAETTKDGVDLETFQLKESDKAALNLLKEKKIIGKLNEWNKGSGVQKMITEGTSECGAIGMIWGTQSDYNTYIKGGKALQKMWLKATSLGIHLHPYASFPVLLNEFNINQDNLQKQEKKAVQNLKEEFQLLVRNKDTVPLLFYRLNKTNITTVKSYRRSILEALVQ